MYVLHKRKRDVLLWCYGVVDEAGPGSSGSTESRKHSIDTPTPTSKRECIAMTISNVETIIEN